MSIATEELSALQNMGAEAQQVEDAQTALDRITPDRDVQRSPGDEASFGTPEAIATAVVGSVLLGPVGGILLGGAQGWLKKRSEQKILDQLASEQNVLTAAADVYVDQLTSFKTSATGAADLLQIETMETGLSVAREFMQSGDPLQRDKGVAIMASVDQTMNAYATRQETQEIAMRARTATDKRALGTELYGRYTSMQSNFDTQSAPYLERKLAANTALAALQSGTPADLHAAMILFNKTLDPNSAVLGEERKAVTEMGGWLDTAYNFALGGATGQQLNSGQRRDLGAAILRIADESTKFQLLREARFSERAIDAQLPDRFHDNFRLVEDAPPARPLNIPDPVKEAVANGAELTGEVGERMMQWVRDDLAKASAQAVSAAEATRDFLGEAGAVLGPKADQAEAYLGNLLRVTSSDRPTN